MAGATDPDNAWQLDSVMPIGGRERPEVGDPAERGGPRRSAARSYLEITRSSAGFSRRIDRVPGATTRRLRPCGQDQPPVPVPSAPCGTAAGPPLRANWYYSTASPRGRRERHRHGNPSHDGRIESGHPSRAPPGGPATCIALFAAAADRLHSRTTRMEGAPASERTEVWIFFDDEQVYTVRRRCWESRP